MNELVTKIRTSQWMEMIHAQKESGLSVSAWCQENGISENCYYYRQQKLRNRNRSKVSTLKSNRRLI